MAVIVGSLCFSVGEGLRLTPFPVSFQEQSDNGLSAAKEAVDGSISKYGPLDVPSQGQKRSKRQTTEFAAQPQAESAPVVTFDWQQLEDNNVRLKSALFVSRPAGRAPPVLS